MRTTQPYTRKARRTNRKHPKRGVMGCVCTAIIGLGVFSANIITNREKVLKVKGYENVDKRLPANGVVRLRVKPAMTKF